jgi:hypothetical protein
MPEPDAVYAYAFVGGRRAPPALGEAGGCPLSFYRSGSLGAVIRSVGLGEFCGQQAEVNLSDPSWVAPRACEHAAVLDRVMRAMPVFPLAFATLFAGLGSLALIMDRHRAAIEAFLRRVEGKEEWGLEVVAHLDRRELIEGLATAKWPQLASLPTGTRYLRLRQAHGELIALARIRAVQTMDALVDALRPVAEVRNRLKQGVGDDDTGGRIGNWSLLVDRADRLVLRRLIDELESRSARYEIWLRLSGPWPPFSFRPCLDPAGCPPLP